MIEAALFYWFALLTLVGGILTVTRRSPVLAAVWLTISLLGVAGLFLLLGAEFLFAAQIIIYIGGITLLFLFVIMLVNLEASARLRQFRRGWPFFVFTGAALAAEFIVAFTRQGMDGFPGSSTSQLANAAAISDDLLSRHLVAFEVISVLLLVAMIGSVWMGQQRKRLTADADSLEGSAFD
jgi:NADH-quinone oxidoreductase subunit J